MLVKSIFPARKRQQIRAEPVNGHLLSRQKMAFTETFPTEFGIMAITKLHIKLWFGKIIQARNSLNKGLPPYKDTPFGKQVATISFEVYLL